MTPWQFSIAMDTDIQERQEAHQFRAWQAWHTAALYRVKKMPKLSEIIGDKQKRNVAADLKATMKANFPSRRR